MALLYAATFQDCPRVINIAGRFDMRAGVAERFGAENMATLLVEGRLELADRLVRVPARSPTGTSPAAPTRGGVKPTSR